VHLLQIIAIPVARQKDVTLDIKMSYRN